MTDRMEELRAQQKERIVGDDNLISYKGGTGTSAVAMMWHEAEAALTEALDIAEKMTNYLIVANRTNARRGQRLAEQERLLERAERICRTILFDTTEPLVSSVSKLLSDLNARSVPALGVNEGQTSAAPASHGEVSGPLTQGPTGDHEQGRKHRQPWCLTHDAPMVCSAELHEAPQIEPFGELDPILEDGDFNQ